MFSLHVILATLLFLSQISSVTSKAISHSPYGLHNRRRDLDESLGRTALDVIERSFSERDATPSTTTEELGSSVSVSAASSSASTIDTAINDACTSALSGLTDFISDTGLGGCYNLMYLNTSTGVFQADLRLFKVSEPSGAFAGVNISDMIVKLQSNVTRFAQLSFNSKARRADLETRQTSQNYSEILDTQWEGQIEPLDYSKLSETDFMALVIPQFDIRAIQPTTQTPVNTQLNASSAVYFVTGVYHDRTPEQAIAATGPAAAAAAAAKAGVFVIPGRTLGIFPIGLIVTGTWALLFITTFGLGTLGRMQHRRMYRSRLVALGRLRSL